MREVQKENRLPVLQTKAGLAPAPKEKERKAESMTDLNLKTFLKDRREALTKAVMKDDWKAARKYCKKYGVEMPKDSRIFKAGIYKAVQGCTDIPDNIKEIAWAKCLALGFRPYIEPYEVGNDETD